MPSLPNANWTHDWSESACFHFTQSIVMYAACSVSNIIFLIVFLCVLWIGAQECFYRRRSVSYSEAFVYHASFMRLLSLLGFTGFFWGGYLNRGWAAPAGIFVWSISNHGQSKLYVLTCVERYLAVVRPVTYRRLTVTGGAVLKHASAARVWLHCAAWAVFVLFCGDDFYILDWCLKSVNVVAVGLCSASVLCALRKPGPGRAGADRIKRRAFHTIAATAAVLLLMFVGNLLNTTLRSFEAIPHSCLCILVMSDAWFELPSSLLLPSLFLQRRGFLKLDRRRHRNQPVPRPD